MQTDTVLEVAAEQRFEAWMQQRRLHSVFQTVQNYATLALWNMTRDLDNIEKTSALLIQKTSGQ